MKKQELPCKTKYFKVTDSVLVPWGKGEKNPGREVKRAWNFNPKNNRRVNEPNYLPVEEGTDKFWLLSKRLKYNLKPEWKRVITIVIAFVYYQKLESNWSNLVQNET